MPIASSEKLSTIGSESAYVNISFKPVLVSAMIAAACGVVMTAGSVMLFRTKSLTATNFGVMIVWTIASAVRHAKPKYSVKSSIWNASPRENLSTARPAVTRNEQP